MKAAIKAEYLKELINIAYSCSTEIRLNITKQKLFFSVVDFSNVLLLHMEIKPSVFEGRIIDEDFEACIDVAKIRTFMGVFKGFVDLEIDDSYITLANIKYRYSAPLLKCERVKKTPNTPDIKLVSKAIVKVSDFRTFIRAYKKEFDKIYFECNEVFKAYDSKENPLLSYTEQTGAPNNERVRSHYSVQYVNDTLSAIAGDIDIEMNDDYPIKMHFDAIGGYAKGYFMIAPRIEEAD